MEFVADLSPHASLAPRCGTMERVKLGEWLHFLSNGIPRHDQLCYSRDLSTPPLKARLAWIDLQLTTQPFLMGQTYSIADIYLWTLWSWMAGHLANAADYGNIATWSRRIAERRHVQDALRAERSPQ